MVPLLLLPLNEAVTGKALAFERVIFELALQVTEKPACGKEVIVVVPALLLSQN